ncbi:glycerophosphodiester phosphodiesterase [Streptomyces iranensis]|uniref:Glycerophosphoryl diester phosphodiesterase n=1 Tax=Streptomyces iranensis TaxID=576784 RepID=A0A061A4K7_9ACTN|nr:glycerophosphodiester phosphodiesterase family protein [Streptomyces iranensis]MBP2059168.1 glycerophosphoryl diester phosphodiesterase [Streptomyces iranensis]CDR11662.1 glycerophosphoryl diester phosphodiesterase [Streptomyces iranensis]
MQIRPAAALTGALIGMSALFLPTATAQATGRTTHHHTVTVAHRGASAYAPENTLAAVDAADDLGIDWVENDVQRTRDGELIVMHDTTLNRTTDVEQIFPDRAPWKISDFTLDEIEKLDAGSWFGPEFQGETVPTLEEYMDRVSDNHQKLLLELKAPELYPGIERQTLRELRREGWLDHRHKRRLIVQSFSADSMRAVHRLRPDVKTGFLGTPAVADLPEYAEFSDQINPSYTTIDADYVSAVRSVDGAHGRPLEVYTWTVNDGPTAVSVAAMGVNGIITNKPDVIRDALDDAS